MIESVKLSDVELLIVDRKPLESFIKDLSKYKKLDLVISEKGTINVKRLIPKEVKVPDLTSRQIEALTELVFLPEETVPVCEAVFVFAGTHPGHWEKAIEAYQKDLCQKVIVTGGVSPTGVKHPDWKDARVPEAEVILSELIKGGIRQDDIVFENRSRNTLENILFAKEVFDFTTIKRLLFVCKNHAAGRQYRTLAEHLPSDIRYYPFGFDAEYRGIKISRNSWMMSDAGRSRVMGEYIRIVQYGRMGHLLPLENEIAGLDIRLADC